MAGRPRKAAIAGAAPAPLADAAPQDAEHDLPFHHRENPNKLSGEKLREFAHKNGLARSVLETMSDEKIRQQLQFVAYRRASQDE